MRAVLRTPESMWLTVPSAASRSTITERSFSICSRSIWDQSNAVAFVTAPSVKIAIARSSARRMLRRTDGWRLSRYSAAGFGSRGASDSSAAFVSAAPEGSLPWRSTSSATVPVSPCSRESTRPIPPSPASDDCASVASPRRVSLRLTPRRQSRNGDACECRGHRHRGRRRNPVGRAGAGGGPAEPPLWKQRIDAVADALTTGGRKATTGRSSASCPALPIRGRAVCRNSTSPRCD